MPRSLLVLGVLALLSTSAGCRCFPGFNAYGDWIDDIGDDECTLEGFYDPRWDISRAGRPDWCGPINRWLGDCRCCNQGQWDRANECWRYPPRYPYWYPGQSVLPPGMTFPQEAVSPSPATTPDPVVPESAPPAESAPLPPSPFGDGQPPALPAAPPPAVESPASVPDVEPVFELPL